MLALRTGWTDATIAGGITEDFRRACHQVLYAERMAEDLARAREIARGAEALDLSDPRSVPVAERARVRAIRELAPAYLRNLEIAMGLREPEEAD